MSIPQRLVGVVVLATSSVVFAQTTETKPPDKDTSITSGSAIEQAVRAVAAANSATRAQKGLDQAEILTDTMGVDFDPYLARVLHAVKKHWFELLPESDRTKRSKWVFEFAIQKDGSLTGLKVAGGAGEVALARPAYNSILASNPFPPLPAEFRGQYLGLRLGFVCNPMVSVSPTRVKVRIGESQQFSATVETTGETTVDWTISGKGCVGEACGSISAAGLYKAPATLPDPPRVMVTAMPKSDPGESATATVEIVKHEEKPSGESDVVPQKQ